MEDAVYWFATLGIITGVFIVLWLKERPLFECVECSTKVKHNQHHCHNCGGRFNWSWYRRRPWLFTRYQTDEQFRKWTILVPVTDKPKPK